ncbi:MAG: hypothetical protein M3336_01785, partial [Chloroflexota bacterium]|nr:hypothetical protein [Chloroflexota bacterium]
MNDDERMPDVLAMIAASCTAAVERRFEDAAVLAAQALESAPACLPALRTLAWAQLELGDERALNTLQACSSYDPEDSLAHVGVAIFLQQREQTEAAAHAWEQAWELDPHNQSIRRALVNLTGDLPDSPLAEGISLLRAERFEEAEALLESASSARPAAAPLARLDALWGMGQWRRAFDLAVSVAVDQPRSVKAML